MLPGSAGRLELRQGILTVLDSPCVPRDVGQGILTDLASPDVLPWDVAAELGRAGRDLIAQATACRSKDGTRKDRNEP